MAIIGNTISNDPAGRGRAGAAASRWASAMLALLVGIALLALGLPRLEAALIVLPATPALEALSAGRSVDRRTLEAAARAHERALSFAADTANAEALGRLRLAEVSLQDPAAPADREALNRSIAALRQSLALAPASPYRWLDLAFAEGLAAGIGPAVLPALRMSVATGPYTRGLLMRRLGLGLRVWTSLDPTTRGVLEADIRALGRDNPYMLAVFAKQQYAAATIRRALGDDPASLRRFDEIYVRPADTLDKMPVNPP
jgi:hypothetical protein